jgi:glycosyltransferase involved in cell wall biosynthesis
VRVLCLTKRWSHHTKSGGYDQLADSIESIIVRRRKSSSIFFLGLEKIWYKLRRDRSYLLDYQLGDLVAENEALFRSWYHRADLIHVLYGDDQLDFLLRRNALCPCPITATFHLPIEYVKQRFEHVQRRELSRLSGAIVVSSYQLKGFRRWLGPENVIYIPHGINIHVFVPRERPQNSRLNLLFVGHYLRDFELAHWVIDQCAFRNLKVSFDVVVPEKHFKFFTGCANVHLLSGIPEEDLIHLYQRADALFLPFLDATANNAILESLACGTPVITSDLGGIRDYIDESCGWLLPSGDRDSALACVCALAQNPTLAESKRRAARLRAEEFSWERVAAAVDAAYSRIVLTGVISDGTERIEG